METETETVSGIYQGISLPLLSVFSSAAVLLVLLPSAALVGYWTGQWQRRRAEATGRAVDTTLGETTLGGTLALLGLMLAFTFGHALSTFQTRSHAVLVEANAIGTAFLRADYLPGAGREVLRAALLDYTRTRISPPGAIGPSVDEVLAFVDRTMTAQAALWPITLEATADPEMPAALKTFVAGAVNDVLDAHAIRVQAYSVPLQPVTTLMTLSLAVIVLFLLGNRTAMRGRDLTWRTFVFAAMLWVVMVTILDTQRSAQGLVTVDEGALIALLLDMEQSIAAEAG